MNVDAEAKIAQATILIRTLGYGRRTEEVSDAEVGLEKQDD